MRSLLHDPPALQHRDPVGQCDRRRTVRDHQRRSPRHDSRQGRTDLVLLRRVHRRRRVVQHEYGGIGEDRPRDRHTLALAAREGEAALAEESAVTVRQVGDEPRRPRQLRCALDVLVTRIRTREPDVLAHGVRKEKRLLEDERDRTTHVRDPKLTNIVTVQRNAARVGVVQPREQSRNGALPGPGRPDQGHRLTRSDVQVQPVQNRMTALVSELDARQAHVTSYGPLQRLRMARVAELRLGVQHLGDARARAERLLQRRDTLAEHAQRPDKHRDIRVERDERAEAEIARDHASPAEPEHGDQPEHREELERRHEHRIQPGDVERAVDDRAAACPELRGQRAPGPEAFHDPDAAHGLLDQRGRLAPALLQPLGARVVAPRVRPAGKRDQRQRDQHDQRQLPVQKEQHNRDREHRQDVTDRVADRVHHPRDVLRVGRRTRHQLARPNAVVVARVQAKRVREDRVANARVRPCPVLDRVQVPDGARTHLQQPDRQQRTEPDQQRARVLRQHPVVDRILDHQRRRDRSGLPEQAGQSGARDPACLRTNHGAHEPPRRAPTHVVIPHR